MKRIKKSIAVLLATAMTFSNFAGFGGAKEVKAGTTVEVKNYSFEETTTDSSGKVNAKNWSTNSAAQVVSYGAQSGSKCLMIKNSSITVNQITQSVELEPNTEYVLEGYIKGENISAQNEKGEDYGDGATIDFDEETAYMIDHENNWKQGSFGWTKVTVYFVTTSRGRATLRCRLGHSFGKTKGTAYFDNISIKKMAYPNKNRIKIEDKNVRGYITKDIVNEIGMGKYQQWLRIMQEAYEQYADLTGSIPFYGDVLNIIDTDEPMIQQYGALGNYNPILYNDRQMNNFKQFANEGITNFGHMHEMGHSFDTKTYGGGSYGWDFEGEFWANTKMLYVLDHTNDIKVQIGGIVISNSQEAVAYYKTKSEGGYDNSIAKGKFTNSNYDALTYIIIKLVQKIGWEPFKATFRQYVNDAVPASRTTFGKFNQFLNVLQQNYNANGTEVMDCIGQRDFNILKNGMEGGDDNYFSDYLSYSSVVQGNSSFEPYVSGGQVSGTEGKSKKITKLCIKTPKVNGISFRAYINGEWTQWQSGDSVLDGNNQDIEALQIKLTGQLEQTCNVYYRTHNRYYGWLGWTSNGATAGTRNVGGAIEGFQIQIVEKGTSVDGITNDTKESSKEKYKVVFKDYNGAVLKTELVEYGANATAPSNPARTGYTFIGWSDSYTNVKGDIEITAQYEKEKNKTTIYYKGYDNPYIHYKVGNGSWTKVPGVKMEANTDVDGYNYAITIDLNEATSLTACFNDGNNNWDSNNNKNYTFGTGYYTYNNQKITKIAKPEKKLKITNIYTTPEGSCIPGKQLFIKTETQNAQGTLQYKYVATYPDGKTYVLRNYTTYNELSWMLSTVGKYKITVYVTDGVSTAEKTIDYEVTEYRDLSVSKLESSLGTELVQGQTTTISVEADGGYSPYYYSIKVNGQEILQNAESTSAEFTPSKPGTYSVVATVKDARSGSAEKTMTINVEETNKTTIYYKGYSTPYIHYRVGNGTWSSAPGVKMQSGSDVDGYDYTITIDLGEQTNMTACFNDGNGSWDSNNGQNYTFGVGYYTCSNGKITKIEKPSSELRIKSVSSSQGDTIKCNVPTDLTINAAGGEGSYTYSMYYYAYGSGRVNYLLNNSKNNTVQFTESYPRTVTLYVTVKDEAGNEVQYQKKLEVKEVTNNQTTIYYKGYSNPYIHYRVGNGTWSSAPGVKMQSGSDVDGYDYTITIDLGEQTNMTACFNDGNGSWDSNNGQNYTFGVGYYTCSNGKITKIEKPSSELRIKSVSSSQGDTIKCNVPTDLTINAAGGEGSYTYSMYYYAYGSGRVNYLLNNSKNNTVQFTESYPRTVTLYVTVKDEAGNEVQYQKKLAVKEVTSNQVTIYYNGYNNPNIHYMIENGSWTSAPGVKMEASSEVSGYPYAITIDLGEATSLTACFNDGNNHWDSANGANYTFGVGTYTYSNGTITKIN